MLIFLSHSLNEGKHERHMTVKLTSVHHSIELHRHADAACAVGGEVQGRVLPAFYKEDDDKEELC